MFKEIPPLFEHQVRDVETAIKAKRIYDASDPGTGKTRTQIEVIRRLQKEGAGKALILATKSILVPAWANDIRQFAPEKTYVVAKATNRKKAFDTDVDIYITNHDAAKWVDKNMMTRIKKEFDLLVIDEATAYKNRTSERSKAAKNISSAMDYVAALSGTPNPQSILDLWHQMLIVDGGERLGTSFWRFRSSVCEPRQTGPRPEMVEWVDKEGAEEAVMDILSDVMIRNKLEDCHDMPDTSTIRYNFALSPKHMALYKKFESEMVLQAKDGSVITALHAGTLANKLLQLASGALYDEDGNAKVIDDDRYELVIDLVKEHGNCLVAFNWTHQRDGLIAHAKKAGLRYGLIDGSVKVSDREKVVAQFQNGELDVIFAHPQSAGHGLTLTNGQTTIWTSPTPNAEHYRQFNGRQYRAGQKKKTRVIQICAEGTGEERVYDVLLGGKLSRMNLFLALAETLAA